jgi:hypothetical protein
MTNKIILFTAQTENGSSAAFNAIGNVSSAYAQPTFLTVYGVFGGASVQLEYLAADGSYYSTGDAAFTSSSADFARINPSLPYRLTISNAGGTTSIGATVYNATLA